MKEIIIKDLWFRFPETERWVLKNINLEIEKGEFFVLTGPSGAGKSILSLSISGLIPHTIYGKMKGEVIVGGLDTRRHTISEVIQKVGIVFQDPENQFLGLSVEEDIVMGLENLGFPSDEIEERLNWALDVTRMRGFEKKAPYECSGGQKARVAIASAIDQRPEILILDNPTVELDPIGKQEVMSVVSELNKKYRITVFMATYETEVVTEYADRFAYIEEGKILREGKTEEFFEDVDFLLQGGVDVPQVTELSHKLKMDKLFFDRYPISLTSAIEIYRRELQR